jgi:hypothetical protein
MPEKIMDWFEKLTGFRESGYEDTRARLEVADGKLRSRANGASYGMASLNWFHFRLFVKGQNPRATYPVGSRRVW